MFVLDSSGSIGGNFASVTQLVTNFIDTADIGSDATLVGVVRYSDLSTVEIPLGNITNAADLRTAVDGISNTVGGRTFTNLGITEGVRQFNQLGRAGADRFMIVVTDGASTNRSLTVRSAAEAKTLNIEIIAIGVGAAVPEELNDIATGPGTANTFIVTDFTALSQLATNITSAACGQ